MVPSVIPLCPSFLNCPSLAFLYGGTLQQRPSIKGMGLVSEPRHLPPTRWAGWWWRVFFYTFRQRGSVWNSAFSPSNPRNYSVFQGPKPVTTSQPLPSHLCHVSSDREMGELWVQEGQKNRASHAQKTFIESTVIHKQKAPTLESLPLPPIEL